MSKHFAAQTLRHTRPADGNSRFELTFADASGVEQTISLPHRVAAELAPVLAALSAGSPQNGPRFTRLPKLWAVGSARHERLVLIRFDDDPPYGLAVEEAQHLWQVVREEAGEVAQRKALARQ
jgi:hypothetical protein